MANSGITKIQFIDAGFKAIVQSEGCQQLVTDVTQEICDKANANNDRGGEGFNARVILGGRAHRYVGFVTTTDKQSKIAEAEDKALTRALS